MDGTVGFPCMTPGNAMEWHLPDLSIRVYAMDADIAVPPILQYPIDGRALELAQSSPWYSGRLRKQIYVWCHECALETECRVVHSQKVAQQPVGGKSILLRHPRQPKNGRLPHGSVVDGRA